MKLSHKILIPIALFILVIGSLVVVVAYQILNRTLLQEKFLEIGEDVRRSAASFLSEKTFSQPHDILSEQEFAEFVSAVQNSAITRVTVWDDKNIVLFSDLKQLQGRQSETPAEISLAFQKGIAHSVFRVKDTNIPKQTETQNFIDIFVPLHINGTMPAVVEIYTASEVILGAVRKNTTLIAFLFLFGGAVALFVIYLVLRWSILKNIERLTVATKTISGGNFNTPLVSASVDEIGQLAGHFDKMREKIKILTERMEEEVRSRTQAWQEEKARLAASIQSISFGFIIADVNHQILLDNNAVWSILNISGERLTALSPERIFMKYLDFHTYATECMKEKKVIQIKSISVGQKFIRVIFTPIVIASVNEERVIGYVVLIEDITEAKLLERAKDEFFAVASHELRTPLTVIRGNMSMLKEFYGDKMDADGQDMVHDSYEASMHLIAIVNDFLDTSRLEQGRIIFRRETVDLSTLAESVLIELRVLAETKGLAVHYEKPSETFPCVIADHQRVRQVIYNLVGNAIAYTHHGGISVGIKREGDFLRITIGDTGMGISMQNQKLLFKKFQQAGENLLTRDVTSGTGLGLYISKLLVNTMGGEIGLDHSELNSGSTFFFTLPLVNTQEKTIIKEN